MDYNEQLNLLQAELINAASEDELKVVELKIKIVQMMQASDGKIPEQQIEMLSEEWKNSDDETDLVQLSRKLEMLLEINGIDLNSEEKCVVNESDSEEEYFEILEETNDNGISLSTDEMVVDLGKGLGDNIKSAGTSVLRKKYKKGHCPKCGSARIDIWQQGINSKAVTKHGLFKSTTKEKPKKSAAKVGMAVMTLGASAVITGTNKTIKNQYHCKDCGYTWEAKAK